jgi:heme oxygenase
MSLREITKEKHHEAETTKFAKLLLGGKIEKPEYANYLTQMLEIYAVLEYQCAVNGFLDSLAGLPRFTGIYDDLCEIDPDSQYRNLLPSTRAYVEYLNELASDSEKANLLKAHLYCRHMGDLFGGQIIKKQVAHISSGKFYDFRNVDELKVAIRSILTDDLGDEANVAFDYTIKIMRELYEPSMEHAD